MDNQMHKVGFLPFIGINYGSTLQSCAVYGAIKMLGYDCEVIDCGRGNEFVKEWPNPDPSMQNENAVKYNQQLMKCNFYSFIAKYFNFNKKMGWVNVNGILNEVQEKELDKYDAFVCGSDQIWNPNRFWFSAKRYLQFAPEEKRIAYAPSVGWKKIPDFLNLRKPQWAEWLSSVKYISCRETASSETISKIIGRTVETVIDPTLLLQPEDWLKLMPEGKYSDEISQVLASGKPYLLAYLLDSLNEKELQYVRDIAKKQNLEIVWLLGRDTSSAVTANCAGTDPAGFVKLICNASFVCTDGFHGTCFSLNFSRPFVIFKNSGFRNDARIEDLLQRVGASDRVVNLDKSVDELVVQMDYVPIQENLERERQKSLKWLKGALEGAIFRRGSVYDKATNEMIAQKMKKEENLSKYLEMSDTVKNLLRIIVINPENNERLNALNVIEIIYKYIPCINPDPLYKAVANELGYAVVMYGDKVLYEGIFKEENEILFKQKIESLTLELNTIKEEKLLGVELKLNDEVFQVEKPGLNLIDYDLLNYRMIDQKYMCLGGKEQELLSYAQLQLKNERDFYDYLQKLSKLKDEVIIIAVRDTITTNSKITHISSEAYALLQKMGFHQLGHGPEREFWSGYLAIKYKNFVVYEQLAPQFNSLFNELRLGGVNIKAISSPNKAFNTASVKIEDKELAVNERGLNIVTYDPVHKRLVDSVAFDTWKSNIPAIRNLKENNFYNYLDILCTFDNYLIIIAAKDTINPQSDNTIISTEGYKKLEVLGINQLGHDCNKEFWAGYIAIINNHKIVYEKLGSRNQKLKFEGKIDGLKIYVESAPYKSGNNASIKINDKEYAINKRGLNIVVFDTYNKILIDSIAFDTWDKNIPAFYNKQKNETKEIVDKTIFLKNMTLSDYLDNLSSSSDNLIIFSVKDTISSSPDPRDTNFDEKIVDKINKLELKSLSTGVHNEFQAGYVAIIYKKKIIFEKLAEYGNSVSYSNNLDDLDIIVTSSPYNAKNMASIKINGMEYAVNSRGINIVLFDIKNKCLIDSVAFDTWRENVPAQRNMLVNSKSVAGNLQSELSTHSVQTNLKVDRLYKDPLFNKIKIIAALLRDYNITHVVLSSGNRHAPLVRMFENNKDIFTLYSVVDERSAGYFALGMAAELNEPVACLCTSGTAASNYLPPVTEAFFTGIPLVIITADRLEFLHNHGEDQTIPQHNMFAEVVKKSITLPEGCGKFDLYQTRRDVIDCILECIHHTPGPVHINLAIDNVWLGRDVPGEYWQLQKVQPKQIEPHIERVEVDNDSPALMDCLDKLKTSSRILLVYGQNPPPTQKQLENIEKFSAKFNCVILTDLISNLHTSRTLQTFNMLEKMSQQEFDDNFAPEILIVVGGKRLMNDPLTDKIRRSNKNMQCWIVNPDGELKDFYFKLSKIIECYQDYFFDWFANNAEDNENDDIYFELWKKAADKCVYPVTEKFNSHYIQRKFLPAIPPHSILHLGVGLSFYYTRRYMPHNTVKVYCNMGTNGIDGCTSSFMGACANVKNNLCFLLVGDLSFFYDMNSIWNKKLHRNMRILLDNNNGSDLLRHNNLENISCVHGTLAKPWVEAAGFEYLCAYNKEEFDARLQYFVSDAPERAVFFEAIYNI